MKREKMVEELGLWFSGMTAKTGGGTDDEGIASDDEGRDER